MMDGVSVIRLKWIILYLLGIAVWIAGSLNIYLSLGFFILAILESLLLSKDQVVLLKTLNLDVPGYMLYTNKIPLLSIFAAGVIYHSFEIRAVRPVSSYLVYPLSLIVIGHIYLIQSFSDIINRDKSFNKNSTTGILIFLVLSLGLRLLSNFVLAVSLLFIFEILVTVFKIRYFYDESFLHSAPIFSLLSASEPLAFLIMLPPFSWSGRYVFPIILLFFGVLLLLSILFQKNTESP